MTPPGIQAGSKARPVATLLILATVFPELFTGSTSLVAFLNPGLLLWLVLGYGLAVLLVRELWVRLGGGLPALFLLGLAYGIFNEGLLAKTVLLDQHLPIPQYDHYGVMLGISFPWMAGISVWHACASVIFPILLVHFRFPASEAKPWIRAATAIILGGLLLALACAAFSSATNAGIKGTQAQLEVLLGLMAALCALAFATSGTVGRCPPGSFLKPLLLGFSVLAPFRLLEFLAGSKWPLVVFYPALGAFVIFYGKVLRRHHWIEMPGILLFGVGWYLQNAVQAWLVIALSGNPALALCTMVVDILFLLFLFRGLRRRGLALEPAAGSQENQ